MSPAPAGPLPPAPSAEYQRWRDGLIAAGPVPLPLDLPRLRALADAQGDRLPLPPGVTLEPVEAGGVPAAWIRGSGTADGPVMLHFHGGAYIGGSIRANGRFAAHVAHRCGLRGLTVDYRLAPEHPFPAAVEDGVAVYRWLRAQGLPADRILLAGESAGAGLAVAVALALHEQGEPGPAGLVGLCGWFDLTLTAASLTANAEADVALSASVLRAATVAYLPDGDAGRALASPVYADPAVLAGLPPLFLQAGGAEILRDDSVELAARARAADVPVTLEIWPEMVHVFQRGPGMVPESDRALDAVARWVHERLDVPAPS